MSTFHLIANSVVPPGVILDDRQTAALLVQAHLEDVTRHSVFDDESIPDEWRRYWWDRGTDARLRQRVLSSILVHGGAFIIDAGLSAGWEFEDRHLRPLISRLPFIHAIKGVRPEMLAWNLHDNETSGREEFITKFSYDGFDYKMSRTALTFNRHSPEVRSLIPNSLFRNADELAHVLGNPLFLHVFYELSYQALMSLDMLGLSVTGEARRLRELGSRFRALLETDKGKFWLWLLEDSGLDVERPYRLHGRMLQKLRGFLPFAHAAYLRAASRAYFGARYGLPVLAPIRNRLPWRARNTTGENIQGVYEIGLREIKEWPFVDSLGELEARLESRPMRLFHEFLWGWAQALCDGDLASEGQFRRELIAIKDEIRLIGRVRRIGRFTVFAGLGIDTAAMISGISPGPVVSAIGAGILATEFGLRQTHPWLMTD